MESYNSKKPLLTAIIFTYNHHDTIAKCIESHLNQKTEYPYIIKIYDDCSNDGTTEICKEYEKKYPDKIKLIVQPENTFTKPYLQLQSYQAISAIDTKYFCVIDGDDYWCNENKIQLALDFLENNPEYIGWAHDTCQYHEITDETFSYIHDICKIDKLENPITFDARAPFLLTSSRVFRNLHYANLKILPIDYLIYYYHLSKGWIYYHDEIMAYYTIGLNNTFANMPTHQIINMNSMFAYKLSKLFNFREDAFCSAMQLKYDTNNQIGDKNYKNLCGFKRIFGTKMGWHLWFIWTFVPKYGFCTMNINYIYNRKNVKRKADSKNEKLQLLYTINKLDKRIASKYFKIKCLSIMLKCKPYLPANICKIIEESRNRKYKSIDNINKFKTEYLKRFEQI